MKLEMLESICPRIGVRFSSEQLEKLSFFVEQLLEWNRRFNLVSKNDANLNGITRHILDSLTALQFFPIPSGAKIVDIGSGAGFPAIPLKVVRDDLDFSLIESTHKKSLFLKALAERISLSGFCVFNERAEALSSQDEFKSRYDFATAKALTKLTQTAKLSFPFLKRGGVLICYKGERLEEELETLSQEAGDDVFAVLKKQSISIPEVNVKRNLIAIQKRLDF